jgi:hypothetical protein
LVTAESRLCALEEELGYKYSPSQPRVPAGNADGGQWTSGSGGNGGADALDDETDDSGEDTQDTQDEEEQTAEEVGAISAGAIYSTPGGVNYDDKILDQSAERPWTDEQIDEAQLYGDRIDAFNRMKGEPFTPATRYVHPDTGASVVIDNTTNTIVQIGKPDFIHNVNTGDAPGAVMRPSPNIRPSVGPEGYGKPVGVESGEGIPLHGGGSELAGFPRKPTEGQMEE